MKTLNIRTVSKTKQLGFTIIELVVVILLLGILTATALPRFMDVTDEAHDAVVDAVRGGLLTGAALFRANYIADGENLGATVGYGAGALYPEAAGSGYPTGNVDDGIITTADECTAIFTGLVQVGRPTSATAAFNANAETQEDGIEVAAASVDFVIIKASAATAAGNCTFYYVGQFKTGNGTISHSIPLLTYTSTDGNVVETVYSLSQAD